MERAKEWVFGNIIGNQCAILQPEKGQQFKAIASVYDKEDAALIIKACKSHEAFVGALNEILLAHKNDNIKPKAFYIARYALNLAGEE